MDAMTDEPSTFLANAYDPAYACEVKELAAQILLKAAEYINDNIGDPTARGITGVGDMPPSDARQYALRCFYCLRPTWDDVPEFWWSNDAKGDAARVLALCFAAAIAEDAS